ncbi:hypothetical protein BEN42_14670 [Leptospira interrogans serovar Canicola]|nr:hypothetical protein [Leptospira interrogans serovar Canicola]OQN92134.1 hypothetical protein AR690_15680 [Leptospira interrogans serovar Lai]
MSGTSSFCNLCLFSCFVVNASHLTHVFQAQKGRHFVLITITKQQFREENKYRKHYIRIL